MPALNVLRPPESRVDLERRDIDDGQTKLILGGSLAGGLIGGILIVALALIIRKAIVRRTNKLDIPLSPTESTQDMTTEKDPVARSARARVLGARPRTKLQKERGWLYRQKRKPTQEMAARPLLPSRPRPLRSAQRAVNKDYQQIQQSVRFKEPSTPPPVARVYDSNTKSTYSTVSSESSQARKQLKEILDALRIDMGAAEAGYRLSDWWSRSSRGDPRYSEATSMSLYSQDSIFDRR